MKTFALATFAGLMLTVGVARAGFPPVSLEKAISLASEQLKIRELDRKIFIRGITLESVSMLGGTQVWKVSWSENIELESGKVETGVEVNMRGDVVRLVKRPGDAVRR